MSILKMFAALLMAAGVMQMLATQTHAETLTKPQPSVRLEMQACGWKRPYHYRYRYRPYHPGERSRAPHPHRKVNPND